MTPDIERIIHSSCYHHRQIGNISLTHCHTFPWLCAWDVCYIIFCHWLQIHSGKTGILFSLVLCSLRWVQLVGYVLACRSCSFVCILHHLIITIVQTYLKTLNLSKACQIYFVECVSKIKHIFLVIHCIIYGTGCFQFTTSLIGRAQTLNQPCITFLFVGKSIAYLLIHVYAGH